MYCSVVGALKNNLFEFFLFLHHSGVRDRAPQLWEVLSPKLQQGAAGSGHTQCSTYMLLSYLIHKDAWLHLPQEDSQSSLVLQTAKKPPSTVHLSESMLA